MNSRRWYLINELGYTPEELEDFAREAWDAERVPVRPQASEPPHRDLDTIDGSLLGPSVDTERALDEDFRRLRGE